jgi:hypothetical protein
MEGRGCGWCLSWSWHARGATVIPLASRMATLLLKNLINFDFFSRPVHLVIQDGVTAVASSWARIADIFLVGLGSVVVIVHICSPGLLAFTTLSPLPFALLLPLPPPSPPFPFCTSPLSSLLIFAFFLAAPASANDVAHFLKLVGKHLRPPQVVAVVERVPML